MQELRKYFYQGFLFAPFCITYLFLFLLSCFPYLFLRPASCLPYSSFPEQPQQQRQNRAQQQAGDDGKMKTEIALGIIDVAGQPPQPAFAEAGPQQRANCGQQQTGNHQKFAQFVHVPKMAREDREGNEGFWTRTVKTADESGFGKSQRDFIHQPGVGR